jgi:hypothetical protein
VIKENEMMKIQIMIPVMLISAPVFAANVSNPKCSEMGKISDQYTPAYLAVVDGYNEKGKEVTSEVDMGGIVNESPSVKQSCNGKKTADIKSVRKDAGMGAKNSTAHTASTVPVNSKSTINPLKATCQDFVNLDEVYQPLATFWVAGHTRAGKIKNREVDEEFLATPVVSLIQECKAKPTASFYDKTKIWLKKHV